MARRHWFTANTEAKGRVTEGRAYSRVLGINGMWIRYAQRIADIDGAPRSLYDANGSG